ncbi:sperm receptor for egg jelly-like [Mytilus californianus]|uniref:sperm receptor for egg jelly-like n=1 Tax=Mytilus californianus TaxID=6549 RepID=UPI0022477B2A|nr:sperm receptor for egg jelly-like [Mytilus californianus]
MSGIGNGSYRLDVGSGVVYDVYKDPGQIKHTYTSSGYFVAELVSYNETFKEIMYLQQVIVADYNMTGLSFIIPDKIDLPPGNMTVNVISDSSYPMVTCIYDMGDLINRRIYNLTANITREEPLQLHFTYLTLGNHTVTVKCNNNYDTQIRKHIINVWNECFTVNGIFDRQYSNTSNPMRVFTSTDFDLASRMAVYCSDQSVIFQWKLFTVVNEMEDVPVFEHFPYTPVGNPRGSIRFARGTVPANLYRVTLNVTLQNTWVYEPTYLMFIKSPPFAYIEGGFERNVQVLLKNITLNALNVSYDPELGSGGNQELEFDWTCKRTNVTSLDALDVKYTSNPSSFEDCSELLTVKSRGITVLILPDKMNQGYAIKVNVTLEDMHTEFTQLIYGVFGDPPEMNVKYVIKLKKVEILRYFSN